MKSKFLSALTILLSVPLPALAQPATQTIQSPEVTAEMRAEEAAPRQVVPFDPKNFDKFAGYYQLGPTVIDVVSRDGSHFLNRLTGQMDIEMFPESQTKFFLTVVHAQIGFTSNARGRVTEMIIYQNGHARHMPRINEAAAKKIEAALALRIKSNTPYPGLEALLRKSLEGEEKGVEDYSLLAPMVAINVKADEQGELRRIASLGPLKSISFNSVNPTGHDQYDVVFERGEGMWSAVPGLDGKLDELGWRRLP